MPANTVDPPPHPTSPPPRAERSATSSAVRSCPRRALGAAAAQGLKRGLGDVAGGEPRLLILLGGRVVVDEAVGQHQRPDFEAVVQQPLYRQMLQHVARKAAHRPFLD